MLFSPYSRHLLSIDCNCLLLLLKETLPSLFYNRWPQTAHRRRRRQRPPLLRTRIFLQICQHPHPRSCPLLLQPAPPDVVGVAGGQNENPPYLLKECPSHHPRKQRRCSCSGQIKPQFLQFSSNSVASMCVRCWLLSHLLVCNNQHRHDIYICICRTA